MRHVPCVWFVLFCLLAGCGAQPSATQAPTFGSATAIATALATEQAISPTLMPTALPTNVPTPVPATPAAPEGTEIPVATSTVTITMEGDVQLAGMLYGQGDVAVVLAHQLGGSQLQWSNFAKDVAQQGFTALTFDFRGHGNTGGKRHLGEADADLKAVFTFLADRGFTKIICVGASMGGTACIKAARGSNLIGLVVVSSPLVVQQPLSLRSEDFADLTYPKLFVVAEKDEVRTHVEGMYSISPEPKQLKVFPGGSHGTALLTGGTRDEFRQLLLDFLVQLR